MGIINRIKAALLAGQHGHPKGIVGYLLGEQMVRQHVTETAWTISLLNLQPDNQVLELGFGAGRAIELVAAQIPDGQVSGIDISQTMVRTASHRNVRAIKAGHVNLQRGDLATLPFPDNQFDKIYTIQTLYFWPDPSRTLTEVFRVLKPDGMLVITLSTGRVDSDEVTGLEDYQRILEEQVVPAMKQIGFTQVAIKQGPVSRQYKTTAVIGVK